MANIYIRKLFPHDITHEVSLPTNIVYEYFNIRSITTRNFWGVVNHNSFFEAKI